MFCHEPQKLGRAMSAQTDNKQLREAFARREVKRVSDQSDTAYCVQDCLHPHVGHSLLSTDRDLSIKSSGLLPVG